MAVAAGLRHPSSGALTNVGTWGAYYGSSSFAAGERPLRALRPASAAAFYLFEGGFSG